VIVDCAVYEAGRRRGASVPLEDAFEAARDLADGFVWIGLHQPTMDEIAAVAEEFELHPLAVEDAVHAHQRPKIERYDENVLVVLKTAQYLDREEVVDLGEVLLFLGDRFVVTVRHGEACDVGAVRSGLEADPDRLRWGPGAVLHAIADRVVDEYESVLDDLDVDIDEIEQEVFAGDRRNLAQRIFLLKREVIELRAAVVPLAEPLEVLSAGKVGFVDAHTASYFRDVHDHVLRCAQHVESLDTLLTSVLNANIAQVGMQQNEDMRKISAWVAIVVVPTLIAGIYGMNFEAMPELGWAFGYPFALSLMAVVALALYRNFKRRDWL
jgi:magnesium transporter